MKPVSLFQARPQPKQPEGCAPLAAYWSLSSEQLIAVLHTTPNGLQQTVAANRRNACTSYLTMLGLTALYVLVTEIAKNISMLDWRTRLPNEPNELGHHNPHTL